MGRTRRQHAVHLLYLLALIFLAFVALKTIFLADLNGLATAMICLAVLVAAPKIWHTEWEGWMGS